jgi:hypothetical protein
MRYSRELPRERRPLHNILLDVGNVHRGEHTQSSVVRRASWDLLARLDGCTAADAAQPYDSSCELNTTHSTTPCSLDARCFSIKVYDSRSGALLRH